MGTLTSSATEEGFAGSVIWPHSRERPVTWGHVSVEVLGFPRETVPMQGPGQTWGCSGPGAESPYPSSSPVAAGVLGPMTCARLSWVDPAPAWPQTLDAVASSFPAEGLGSDALSSRTSIFSAIKREIRSRWLLRVPSILKFWRIKNKLHFWAGKLHFPLKGARETERESCLGAGAEVCGQGHGGGPRERTTCLSQNRPCSLPGAPWIKALTAASAAHLHSHSLSLSRWQRDVPRAFIGKLGA